MGAALLIAPPNPRVELWPHQQAARDAVHAAVAARTGGGLVVLPTGAGKTVLFLTIARDLGLPTLVLVHRDELVRQTLVSALRAWPEAYTGVIQAERDEWQDGQRLVVASVQSLHARRLDRMPRNRFGLVVVDEAHHTPASLYTRVLDHFSGRRFLLGVTATPDRLDGVGLHAWYGPEALFGYSIREAVADGVLSHPRQRRIRTEVDLDAVADRGGDFVEGELARAVNTAGRNRAIVEAFQEHGRGRRAVAFCVDVQHARDLAGAFERAGVRAATVTGELGLGNRRTLLEEFAAGEFRVVTTCQVLTEGFDDPAVDAVVMARPTASRGLYVQCVGRGLRRHPGKEDCLVLDITDNCRRHRLASVADLADATPADPGAHRGGGAGRDRDDTAPVGCQDAEDGPVAWTLEEVPPWPELPTLDGYEPRQTWESLPATEAQLRCLRAFHLSPSQALTRGEASYLIVRARELEARFPLPATPRQLGMLHHLGLWREGLSRRDASRIISGALKN